MPEWCEGQLGDFLELKRGYDLPRQLRKRGDVPVVSSSGITDRHAEAKVSAPGVVTGRYGTIGQVFFVTEDFWPLNTTLYVRDFKGNDPRFVSYLLRTIDFSSFVDKAAVPGVNRNHVHMLPVKLPPVGVQRSIAGLLGALDDKIELNRWMNETLESLVATSFAAATEMSGTLPLAELAVATRESVVPYESADEEFDHFSIPAFDDGHRAPVEWGVNIRSAKLLVHPDAVLVSKLNPRIPRVWLPSVSAERRAICSTEFLVLRPRTGVSRELIYAATRSRAFADDLASLATGTSGSHQRAKTDDVLALEVPVPDDPDGFAKRVRPMLARVAANERESRTLAALRDALLPKLISGELRVRDAERAVEQAS